MNNSSYSEKNSKFFYPVLAFSVLAVIAAAVGISFTAKRIHAQKNEPTQTQIDWDNNSAVIIDEEANKLETGIKDDRVTVSEEEFDDEPTSEETEFFVESTAEAAATTEKHIECILPLGTAVLKDYSHGTMVKSKTMNDWRTHNGVDFTGEMGDEIHAVCGGTVSEVKKDDSWGTVVTVEHDSGFTAVYCGLDETMVEPGDKVVTNDVVGILGTIPIESADATHLHFEVIKEGKYVDPISALDLQREED